MQFSLKWFRRKLWASLLTDGLAVARKPESDPVPQGGEGAGVLSARVESESCTAPSRSAQLWVTLCPRPPSPGTGFDPEALTVAL